MPSLRVSRQRRCDRAAVCAGQSCLGSTSRRAPSRPRVHSPRRRSRAPVFGESSGAGLTGRGGRAGEVRRRRRRRGTRPPERDCSRSGMAQRTVPRFSSISRRCVVRPSLGDVASRNGFVEGVETVSPDAQAAIAAARAEILEAHRELRPAVRCLPGCAGLLEPLGIAPGARLCGARRGSLPRRPRRPRRRDDPARGAATLRRDGSESRTRGLRRPSRAGEAGELVDARSVGNGESRT